MVRRLISNGGTYRSHLPCHALPSLRCSSIPSYRHNEAEGEDGPLGTDDGEQVIRQPFVQYRQQ